MEKYVGEHLKHPPYSLDLSPPDFDLFLKLKEPLRRIRFPDLNTLNEEVSSTKKASYAVFKRSQNDSNRVQTSKEIISKVYNVVFCLK